MDLSTTTVPAEPLRMSAAAATGRLLVLALGPAVTVALLLYVAGQARFPDVYAGYGMWAAVALWSPFGFSLPAVLLDHDRDLALPGRPAAVRAVALVPWMLTRSPARLEMWVAVAGWSLVLAVAALGLPR